MGCVGSNTKKQQPKGQQAAANANPAGVPPPNDASPVRTGSAIKPASKLTEEQVVKKRAEMRANLEEGHSKPPPVYIPHFEPISHIEE